ncbi:MAG TPA: MFS transporter [Gemmataceae bacterium]|nr:MFS transporter [Gemmataceae bacterium]
MTTSIAIARDRHIRYWVIAGLCVITAINYVQRNSLGGIETTLREAFRLPDKTLTGRAQSVFFFSYALAQIPSGWLAQRWGSRKALSLYALGWSITAVLIALSPNMRMMIGLQAIMGIFQAGIFPCATLIMADWLPRDRRALGSGLLTGFMYFGGALVFNLTGFFLAGLNRLGEIGKLEQSVAAAFRLPFAPIGWRLLLILYGIPGILWAIWFFLWFRDRPQEHRGVTVAELAVISAGRDVAAPAERSAAIPWLMILLSFAMWMICAQQFLRAGGARFADKWLSTYLQEVPLRTIEDEDARKAHANHLASFALYAGMVGGVLGGWVSDYILRRTGSRRIGRNGVAIASLVAIVLCYLPLFVFHDARVQVFFFCLGALLGSGVNSCGYAACMDVGGKHLFVIFGAMNMVGNFGSFALTEAFRSASELQGGWYNSLALLVAVHAAAAVCWLFINPDRNIGEKQKPLAA